MSARFDYFVVLAEMRTGSNFLESNLNGFRSVTCHGEAFNPVFIGHPDRADLLGMTLDQRTADPMALIDRLIEAPGLNGFRFFHDHDPRIVEPMLADPRCAKIVLTRNPLDSYVSRKIAAETGQWKLTDMKHQRSARIAFDGAEFEDHLTTRQAFQRRIQRGLQTGGQTAFHIDYDDLHDLDILNGLGRWLGLEESLTTLSRALKPQNPQDIAEKVQNLRAMEVVLSRVDPFNLSRTPGFEPRRGPAIPTYRAAAAAPLLFVPLRGGPEARILAWMAGLDGVGPDDLPGGFSQKTLRQWKRTHPGHRTLAVLRHPAARAHRVFCRYIVAGEFAEVREALVRAYHLPLPPLPRMDGYDRDRHRAAFLAFLAFVKGNLAGQTSLRTDSAWATQTALLQGVAQFAPPDLVLREHDLARDLPRLAADLGRAMPDLPAAAPDAPFTLDEICDDAVEAAVRDAYGRDFMAFGYGSWRETARPPLRVV